MPFFYAHVQIIEKIPLTIFEKCDANFFLSTIKHDISFEPMSCDKNITLVARYRCCIFNAPIFQDCSKRWKNFPFFFICSTEKILFPTLSRKTNRLIKPLINDRLAMLTFLSESIMVYLGRFSKVRNICIIWNAKGRTINFHNG